MDEEHRCKNCGKLGHLQNECRLPIMSFGCIGIQVDVPLTKLGKQLYEPNEPTSITKRKAVGDRIRFSLIQRRDTIAYMEFVRGKYQLNKHEHIRILFSKMTKNEIFRIASTESLETLWKQLWNIKVVNKKQIREINHAAFKFGQLKVGLYNQKTKTVLRFDDLIAEFSPIAWETPEWGFPKGRRAHTETIKEAAVREFKEETGLDDNDFRLLYAKPLVELYTGDNGITYKHTYYIAQINMGSKPYVDPTQHVEVGAVGLFTYTEAMTLLRGYHVEKRRILTQLYHAVRSLLV